MNRWISSVLLLVAACGGEAPGTGSEPPGEAPRPAAPAEPEPPTERAVSWLQELLAFDLLGPATDARTIELAGRLNAPVTCPHPGTGCYVELALAGHTAQVHFGDDQALQVWGPNEPFQMVPWVTGVERDIDRGELAAVNVPGTRPDRLWRDAQHVVLLHDHSEESCDGFCPSMIWIAPPNHPAAEGYGFTE